MAKRIGVVLSGCGHLDGSDVLEVVTVQLALARANADVVLAAPDAPVEHTVNHATGQPVNVRPRRNALVESARLLHAPVLDLASVVPEQLDGLIVPGGEGVAWALSSYGTAAERCEVNEHLARLLKAMLASRKPIGLSGLACVPAARVLGPVAGVRLTMGPRASAPAKHAAIMGADVRHGPVNDVLFDQKSRVVSTPAWLSDEASAVAVATGVDKMVRSVLGMARDRHPAPAPAPVAPSTPATGRGRGSA